MILLSLFASLLISNAKAEKSTDSCMQFLQSLFAKPVVEDFSHDFKTKVGTIDVAYKSSVKTIELNPGIKFDSKITEFKTMLEVSSAKKYLSNQKLENLRFSIGDPINKKTEHFFVIKPGTNQINIDHSQRIYSGFMKNLEFVYLKQFKFTEEQMKLIKDSVWSMKERSVLYNAYDPYVHNSVQSGVIAVYSKNSSAPLPLEVWSGNKIIRKDDEVLVELGRFISTNEKVAKEQETTTYLLALASEVMKSDPSISRVVIHAAGPVQERAFARYGFKRIQQHETGIHDFSEKVVMEVTPSDFNKNMLGLLK